MITGTVKHLASLKWCDKMATSFFLHVKPYMVSADTCTVYQKLVTEQVNDDIEVMAAELKVKMKITDLKLVIELLGFIRDFVMVVTFEEMSEEKHRHL